MEEGFLRRVYDITARIPRGKVSTYGQIAFLAGSPRAARIVGAAMYRAPAGLPCHRVLYRDGSLCPGEIFGGPGRQREMRRRRGALPAGWPGGFKTVPVASGGFIERITACSCF